MQKVLFTQEKETLLITLYAKALESRWPDSLLRDHLADKAIRQIDYDFSKLKVTPDKVVGLAMRANVLDQWTRQFLSRNSSATVLHLGCGLDTRVFRVDPPPAVQWFDVDYPDVIELRRNLYPNRDHYSMIASSVTEPDWMLAIPAEQPTMVIAEGLLPYLSGDDVRCLFQRLTNHLASGELAFDACSRFGVRLLKQERSIKATGASLRWGVDDPKEIEAWSRRIHLIEEKTAYDPAETRRLPWGSRMFLRLAEFIPPLKRIGRMMRYRFE